MITITYIDRNGNTMKFTVPDTVAFNIIDALKASSYVKTGSVKYRHWIERPEETT